MLNKGLIGLALAGFFAIEVVQAAGKIELVDAENFGSEWPFTPEEMHLLCLPGNAVVASDPETGRMYALNGAAKIQAKRHALQPLDLIWRDSTEIPGTKVSIGPMIERGLKLCTG